jgi:hypothetical protein
MLLITSHFILWLLQTSCSIFIDVACYNHSRVFYACCTISMHITVILVVMLKSAILLPKNSMCPILPLNKNYLRNYLETKNYLEVPEWQDDSWSGNCWHIIGVLCSGTRYQQVAVILLKIAAPQLHNARSVFSQNNFMMYFNPHITYK